MFQFMWSTNRIPDDWNIGIIGIHIYNKKIKKISNINRIKTLCINAFIEWGVELEKGESYINIKVSRLQSIR